MALSWSLLALAAAWGQAGNAGGDQIIDGIGETSLLARYPLDGDAKDRSRNNRHAEVRGAEPTFADAPRFGGRALSLTSLPDGKVAALELPVSMLAGVDSLSVTAWVRLRTDAPGQQLIALGNSLVCSVTGADANAGFRAVIRSGDEARERVAAAPGVRAGRWAHVAVVLDAAGQTAVLHADGVRVAREMDVPIDLEKLIKATNADGAKAIRVGEGLDGMIRDVRVYSVALSDEQVATIHRNAIGRAGGGAGDRRPRNVVPTATTTPVAVEFAVAKLTGIADVAVTTHVGLLPKLPAFVAATYEGGATGPAVRVIWPAPKDVSAAREPGTYEVKGAVPGTTFEAKAVVTVRPGEPSSPATRPSLRSFALNEVTLDRGPEGHETPFTRDREKFLTALAKTNPDDFLYAFRDAFGQPQPQGARALGGWDDQTTRLRGHATGHYLSAIAQAYASSGHDPALRSNFEAKMNHLIDVLHDLSKRSGNPAQPGGPSIADPTKVPPGAGREGYDSDLAVGKIRTDAQNWGHGFISAYPPDQFIMLEQGASYGGGNHQIWAPYYTLHKILAGLLDCYEVGGNAKALEVAKGMGLWTHARLRAVPAETRFAMWNKYIAGEYGGMNEVMARLHRLTGDERFLDGAKLFDNVALFYGNADRSGGLARNVDTLRGRHANQHVPQVIGALETFGETGEPAYFRIADSFWDIVTTSYSYSIGGVAGARTPNNAECFTAEPDTLWQNGFSEGGQNETCATYNLLKLSRGLAMYRPGVAKHMNYYEGALVNDILASVAEHDAGNTYHIPLNPGARKSFGNADLRGFTCCNGTALESHTKLQDSIYFRGTDDASLHVNLFVASTLTWKTRGATVRQETAFPYSDTTRLTLNKMNGVELFVRVPDWATRGFLVKVNGAERPVEAKPDSYVSLGRDWKDGDAVEIRMPFSFRLSRVMDRPNVASLLYGPVVLAAEESGPRDGWRGLRLDLADPGKSIQGDPSTLRFKIGDVTLKPFFESYGRYSVYFDLAAP